MLSKRFQKFIDKCFKYQFLQRYKFNYGDGCFSKHKIFYSTLPLYIQERYTLYENGWMGYVRNLIDLLGNETWFRAECNVYGTINETYCVVKYHEWTDVVLKKGNKDCVRISNDGPDDAPIDVFWIRLIDFVHSFDSIEQHDAHAHELKHLFLATIWFFICESSPDDIVYTTNNYISPFIS